MSDLLLLEEHIRKRLSDHRKLRRMKVDRDQAWWIRSTGQVQEAKAILLLVRRIKHSVKAVKITWHCAECHIEVSKGARCKVCGKTKREKL